MEVCPPLCSALTEGKDRVGKPTKRNLYRDTDNVSRQLSRFYSSHILLLGIYCHFFSSLMVCLIPYAAEVILFRMAESAEERLDAETNPFPSLVCKSLL